MLLTIDIGNTQITIGLYSNKKLNFTARIGTIHNYTDYNYAGEIDNILLLNNFSCKDVDGAVISSVVPLVGNSVNLAVQKLCGISPLMLNPGVKTGLKIKIDNPAQLGADIVAGAVAASVMYPLPSIIFDFGTATKISVLSKDGSYLGCSITAGINISIEALSQRTATLPLIIAEKPKNIIGTNSIDSMKSGMVYGNLALIEGMTRMIEKELGEKSTVILTGGLSFLFKNLCDRNIIFSDNLLLEGLRIIYEKNHTL